MGWVVVVGDDIDVDGGGVDCGCVIGVVVDYCVYLVVVF